jgi:hypothetical protein
LELLEDVMKRTVAMALAAGALLLGPAAFAQTVQQQTPSHIPGSGQGGYLGDSPTARPPIRPIPPQTGSLQGGYLGREPGAALEAPKPLGWVGADSKPTAFCDAASVEPDRCRSRADADHDMCVKQMPSGAMGYMDCRRTLDLFGWRL